MQRAASGKTKKPATRNQRKHPYLLFRPTAKKIDDTVGIRIAHGGVLVGRSPSWYARVQIPVVQRLFEKEGQGGGNPKVKRLPEQDVGEEGSEGSCHLQFIHFKGFVQNTMRLPLVKNCNVTIGYFSVGEVSVECKE